MSNSDLAFAWKSIGESWSVLTLNGSNVARLITKGVTSDDGDAEATIAQPRKPGKQDTPMQSIFFTASSMCRRESGSSDIATTSMYRARVSLHTGGRACEHVVTDPENRDMKPATRHAIPPEFLRRWVVARPLRS